MEICQSLKRARAARGGSGPDLTTIRRVLRGTTRKRGGVETRGRKAKLTPVKLRSLEAARRRLIKEAKGESEVHVSDVMKAARVTGVCKSTVSKRLSETFGVKWRAPRAEPLRGMADQKERVDMCQKWKRLPNNYFTDQVHAIIDNKVYEIPTYARARVYAKGSRVRGHLRTRGEGAPRLTAAGRSGFRIQSLDRGTLTDPRSAYRGCRV